METENEYLDRLCSIKPKKKHTRKRNAKNTYDSLIFGRSWDDIQAMQMGTYKPKLIKGK